MNVPLQEYAGILFNLVPVALFKADLMKGLECVVDAEFSGGCNASDRLNPASVFPRNGFVIACSRLLIY